MGLTSVGVPASPVTFVNMKTGALTLVETITDPPGRQIIIQYNFPDAAYVNSAVSATPGAHLRGLPDLTL